MYAPQMYSGGALDELSPIFFTSHFLVQLLVNVIICVGANVGLDYWAAQSMSDFYVVSGAAFFNMLLFSIIVSFFMFWSSGNVHKRIKAGENPAVTRRALCDTCFKKVICFSMQEPNWKRRIWLLMWNAWLFPGVAIALVVSLLCMFSSGFKSVGEAEGCKVTEAVYITITACWKAVAASIIFSMVYASAHNEEQEEIADAVNPALPSALGSGDDINQLA